VSNSGAQCAWRWDAWWGRESRFFLLPCASLVGGVSPIARISASCGGSISPNCVTWLGEWVDEPLIVTMGPQVEVGEINLVP
jgi:hypothetical protein